MTQITEYKSFLQALTPRADKLLPAQIDKARFMLSVARQFERSPNLKTCTQESLADSILALAEMGLSPGRNYAYLIPYKTDCKLVLDYRGLLKLMRESGEFVSVHADVVYESDEFSCSHGTNQHLHHVPLLKGHRGKCVAAYSFVVLKGGEESFEVCDRQYLDKVEKASPGSSKSDSPWKNWKDQMLRKTAIRSHSKYLPMTPQLEAAVHHDFGHTIEVASTPVSRVKEDDPMINGLIDDPVKGLASGAGPSKPIKPGEAELSPQELTAP